MKEEFYEKHYKEGVLMDCFPINANKIGFILKDQPKDDTDPRDSHEFPIRLLAYLPQKIEKGLFGSITWYAGIESLKLHANNLDWIVCTNHFNLNETSVKSGWYDVPANEKGHLAKGLVTIDGNVYAYGMVRSVFKRTGIKQWKNITTKKKHPNLYADIEASKETFVGDWVGFSAMDGFTGKDMYAGGN